MAEQTVKKTEKAAADDRVRPKQSKKQRLKRRKRRNRIIRRVLLCFFTILLVAVGGVAAVLGTVFYGPSETARDQLVTSLLETSAAKFVPRLYFSEDEVNEIVARNAVVAPEENTDTSLVVIKANEPVDPDEPEEEYQELELVEVYGPTYKGYMLIVRDPSRVIVGVCHNPLGGYYGKYIDVIAEEYNAVAAINGGAFEDDNGTGGGGTPVGVVYSEGEMLWSRTHNYYNTLVGFDKDDKLIVATGLSAKQTTELNLRDAVTFGPALVVNGEGVVTKGSSSGLNPRTAIGQRADGAVLMLVIDGRQVNSLGASMSDLINVMLEFGAVNAANLDGGSSTKLYYNGEFINDGVAFTGSRRLATTFIVK